MKKITILIILIQLITNIAKTQNNPVGTIGGVFNVSQTGAATYQIPIEVTPGTQGVQPNLSIVYNSQSGNGILGYGWNLSGISAITRAPQTIEQDGQVHGIDLSYKDRFAIDGNRLAIVSGEYGKDGSVYYTEMESFVKVILHKTPHSHITGPTWFEVTTQDGKTIQYGKDYYSRFFLNHKSIYWKVSKIIDEKGNYMTFHYEIVNGEHVIKEIRYTGNSKAGVSPYNKIVFNYKKRTDANTVYVGGQAIKQSNILVQIKVISENKTVRTYEFKYKQDFYQKLVLVGEKGDDGKSYLPTEIVYNSNNIKFKHKQFNNFGTSYKVVPCNINNDNVRDIMRKQYKLKTEGNSNRSTIYFYKSVNGNIASSFFKSAEVYNYYDAIPVDMTGDGLDDICVISKYSSFLQYTFYINKDGNFSSNTNFRVNVISEKKNIHDKLRKDNPLYYSNYRGFGDFDGDGKKELLVFESSQGLYTVGVKLVNGVYKRSQMNLGSGEFIKDADNIITKDFDGDGQTDILVTKGANTKIYTRTSINGVSKMATIYNSGFPTVWHRVYTGDFNGDGKIDILSYAKQSDGSGYWNINYFKGANQGFVARQDAPMSFKVDPKKSNSDFVYYVADFNGDMKDDILEYYIWQQKYIVNVYYSNGNNKFTKEELDISDSFNNIREGNFIGDFNGDGKADLLSMNTNHLYLLMFHPNEIKYNIYSINNGLISNYIEYGRMIDNLGYKVGNNAKYPVLDIQSSINLVRRVTTSMGGKVNYTYFGAKSHIKKGFLGFQKIIVDNYTTKQKTITTKYWQNNSSWKLKKTQTKTFRKNKAISTQIVDYYIKTLNNTLSKKRYFKQITYKTITNHLTGGIEKTTYRYSADNMLASKNVIYTGGGANEKVYTTYKYKSFGFVKKPETITVISTIDGSSFTQKTEYLNYSSTNKLPQIIKQKGTVSVFTYDKFGNVKKKTGGRPYTIEYTYDSKGRFVTEKRSNYKDAYKEKFTYDEFGNILTYTDIRGNKTIYTYDGFGRLTKTVLPEGNVITNELKWYKSGNIVYYKKTYDTEGKESIEYYDKLGRLVKTETKTVNNKTLITTKYYNTDRTLKSETLPHYQGETKSVSYTYLDDGRIAARKTMGVTTTYQYSGYKTTITSPQGVSTKTIDAAGRLRTVTDAGGTIKYYYHGSGQVNKIVYTNGKTITMGYNSTTGYQTYLNDPDAGIVNYRYNGIGELLWMKDAKGNKTDYTYDSFGRLTKESYLPIKNIYYSYYDSGNGVGQIKETNNNGIMQKYTYDKYGRVTSALENIQNKSKLKKFFTYDKYNNLLSENYDADNDGSIDMKLINTYEKGILNNVYIENSNHAYSSVWQLVGINSFGQSTMYSLGNEGVIRDYNNKGFLTAINYGDYYLKYTFDNNKGNLLLRSDSYSGKSEKFTYDNLNRLKTVATHNYSVQKIFYAQNGNINSKTKAGYYSYDRKRLSAVTKINTDGNIHDALNDDVGLSRGIDPFYPPIPTDISHDLQTITYNEFNKIETLTQGKHNYTFIYGANQARKIMKYKYNGTLKKTVYYHGNFEKEVNETTHSVKYIFYIHGIDGLCAVNIIKPIAHPMPPNFSKSTLYYVYTDHLGSIIALRNAVSKRIVARYSYDAWGRRRNPKTLQYTGFTVSSLISRGFTGHEHLDNVQLINMNGRLYDPIIARFLSPDNNVQMPDYTQNLNRYSYALNNPLIYTDPDGELFWLIPIAIGVVAGGYIGASTSAEDGFNLNPKKWGDDWGKRAAIGAIIGGAAGSFAAMALGSAGTGMAGLFSNVGVNASTLSWQITSNAFITGGINSLSTGISTDWDVNSTLMSGVTGMVLGGGLTAGAAAIGNVTFAGSGWGFSKPQGSIGGHFFTKSRVFLNVSLASTNGFSVSAINNYYKGERGKDLWGKALKDGIFAGISAGALTLPFVKPELFPPLRLEKAGFYARYDKFSYFNSSFSSVFSLKKIINYINN